MSLRNVYLFDGYRKNFVTKLGLKRRHDKGAKVKLEMYIIFFQSTFSVTLKIIMKSAIKMHKTCEYSIIFIVTKKCHDKKKCHPKRSRGI